VSQQSKGLGVPPSAFCRNPTGSNAAASLPMAAPWMRSRGEKARHHDDVVRREQGADADGVHRDRSGVAAGGANAGLLHVHPHRARAEGLQGEREERHRAQFAGRPEQVERVGLRRGVEAPRFGQQCVGVPLLRRDHGDDAVTAGHGECGQVGGRPTVGVEVDEDAASDLEDRDVIGERPAADRPVLPRFEAISHVVPPSSRA